MAKHTHASRTAPLWGVLALTFLGSLGTGAVQNGLSFLAESAAGFTSRQNLLLQLTLGVLYIAGALGAGPALRAAIDRFAWLSTRAALAGVLLVIALACLLPWLATRLTDVPVGLTVWIMAAVFSPATGALWPIVESYLSGGRRGARLRGAVGIFNITWSSAVALSLWLMAPVVRPAPLEVLAVLGLVHALAAVLCVAFPADPAAHGDPHDEQWAAEPHPASYARLLGLFRAALPASYVLLSAIGPLMPLLVDRAGLASDSPWRTPVASAWMISRVLVFVLLERWHGWHGRESMMWIGAALLVGGFAAAVGAGWLPGPRTAWLIVGLLIFGAGMAVVYVGALYYAMEVGNAEVDAGGTHEALIGGGYAVGPVCALAAMAAAGGEAASGFPLWLVGLSIVGALGLTLVGRRISARGVPDPAPGP
jgi:hypothetical protein